jgi:phosphoglycerate kinase
MCILSLLINCELNNNSQILTSLITILLLPLCSYCKTQKVLSMQLIDNYNFAGKKAIVRVDFNVPLDKDTLAVTDDTRIRGALPTIQKILKDGGSAVLMSHLGRPKEGPEDKFSLKHVVPSLSELLGKEVKFVDDCIGDKVLKAKASLKPGEVLVLENLRFYKAENKDKEAMPEFAKQLAEGCDVYVNDAFGTAHRSHASTAVIAPIYGI